MKLLLEDIEAKLLEIDKNVFYGAVKSSKIKNDEWNYIVFNRADLSLSSNKTSSNDTYIVTIVRENWIEEGLAEKVIEVMESIRPGMKFANTKSPYTYMVKPGTQEVVVEALSLEFTNARKRCCQ